MKIVLDDIANLQNENSVVTKINNNNTAIEIAMENTLSRDGTAPNQMGADFDMNSNRILNLPKPFFADEPLRLQDLSDFVGGGTVSNIPAGGSTGDVLAKASDADYDAEWISDVAHTDDSLAQFAATTSSELADVISDETGSGALVFGTAPNITSPTGIVKGDVGLGNVDNTADSAKPVSTAQQAALDGKQNLDGDLTAIAALSTTGIVRRTATNTWTCGTTVAITEGGTGATSASAARTALGLAIGTDVQAYHARLADIVGITYAQGDILYYNGTNLVKLAAGTTGNFLKTQGTGANPVWSSIPGGGDMLAANNLSDVANASTSLTNLGGTTVGKAVFTASSAAAARTAIAISTEIGKIEHWPTSDVPAGRLKCDGGSYTRSSYTDLVSVLVKTGTATFTNGSSAVTMTAHGRSVGDPIKLFTTGTLPTNFTAGTHGLVSAGTTYYIKTVTDANTVVLSTSVAGSAISAGSAGSGTHTWVSAPHGDGDGSTTFTVPDFRGEFLRGLDSGRGVDTARATGSLQLDAFQGHWHPVSPGGSSSTGVGSSFIRGGDATGGGFSINGRDATTDGTNGTPRTAAETRPRNVSVNITIRYAA